jgi:hypothetical protein
MVFSSQWLVLELLRGIAMDCFMNFFELSSLLRHQLSHTAPYRAITSHKAKTQQGGNHDL